MFIDVSIVSPKKVIFSGQAKSVIIPGEEGVFEILPFHKRIISRLISGVLIVDGQQLAIKRGVVKVNQNKATIIVEEE
jgi:F-type H+-transporting ATPase subunit epsilon